VTPVAFKGWKAEAIEFFEGLEADNSRTYWQAHKADYEKLVLGPMRELLGDLAAEFGEGNVFRPYRDVRFSADKSPYKTNIAAMIGGIGYVQLSAEGLATGSGYWIMATDQLERYRRAVAADPTGKALDAIVATATRAGMRVTAHESLKSAPRGYPTDHPRIELLRLKGLITWREWPVAAWLGTAKAETRVEEFLRASAPLRGWLDEPVGASTQPPPVR
jgi:uncharacterized protein (TIGR02453 family)